MDTRLHKFRWLVGQQLLSNQHRSVMNDVIIQVLPLQADMAILRRFIDSYLNFIDDEEPPPFYFKPAAPMVLLELIHYPFLATATRNLDAYSQHELSFTVPLECYALEGGILVFKGFANCMPFIYLDQLASIVSGRDLFGIPKIDCAFYDVHPPDDPSGPTPMLNLALRVQGPIGDNYVSFIELLREPRPFSSARNAQREAIQAFPSRIADYNEAIVGALENWAQMPLSGYDGIMDIHSMLAMTRAQVDSSMRGYPRVFPFQFAPGAYASTADAELGPNYIDLITLKENRDAEDPESACFQSIVRSTMYVDRVNDGGPLFDPMGRSSLSDVNVILHKIESQPVIESLGLKVENSVSSAHSPATGSRRATSKVNVVSTLRPILPYWVKVDLVYGLGTNLYWRSTNNDWSFDEDPGPLTGRKNPYITFGGGAQMEDPSCLVAPQGNVCVWGLPVDLAKGKTRLAETCERYLCNDYFDFRLCKNNTLSDLVYLILRNVTNTSSGGGPQWEEELSFAVFVDMHRKGASADASPIATLLFPIYQLTDNESRDLTNSEVFGKPCELAEFKVVGPDWTQANVKEKDSLLSTVNVSTTILPTLFTGGSPQQRLLLSIAADDAAPPLGIFPIPIIVNPHTAKSDPTTRWKARAVRRWLKRNFGKGKSPVYVVSVSLKQVMDCRFPEAAAYQAIIFDAIQKKPEDPNDPSKPQPMEFPVNVSISRYGSIPLVETLGLESEPHPGQFTTIDVIRGESIHSFAAPIEETGAVTLVRRLGAAEWQPEPGWLDALERKAPGVTKAWHI